MSNLKLLWRIIAVIIVMFLCIVLLPLVGVVLECRPLGGVPAAGSANLPTGNRDITADLGNYARLEDQTYLTVPEWYIVYSADEYAAFIANNPPSRFPYFQAVVQYWRTYYDVCGLTRLRYPFNSGYHLTLVVIGTSFTIENIGKGLYEGTVGRVTEWLSSAELSEEDTYARQVAQDYGDFIHTVPWYEFPYNEKLDGLWNQSGSGGQNAIRSWERKAALSLEYGGKAIYARLLKQGTQSAYAPEDLEITVWAEGVSEEILQQPQVRLVKEIDDRSALVVLPRYEAFSQLVPKLARQGVRFVEIAGNDEILISAIAPVDWNYDLSEGEVLFAMEILTRPDLKRVVVKGPVESLHTILIELENSQAELEHVYDY